MKKNIIKKSISTHFAFIFVTLLVIVILFVMVANGTMLQEFLKNSKKRDLIECYDKMRELFSDAELDTSSEEFDLEFDRIADTGCNTVLIINSALETVAVSGDYSERLLRRLFSYIFKDDPNYLFRLSGNDHEEGLSANGLGTGGYRQPIDDPARHDPMHAGETDNIRDDIIIEETKDYQIRMSVDPHMENDYIELVGSLGRDDYIFIRSAVEGIRSNVKVSSRFLLYVVLLAFVLGTVMILVVTRRITKPILELAELSERMTNLDFDARYEGREENEIGYLGRRMNKMSDTLQNTIAELKTANNELKVDLEKREQLDMMRSDFISNVSHELKTPLAIIQGYAEGLREAVNDDDESREYYCDVIIDEADKMNRMVKNLLTLNQLEFGRDVINMERFDLAELVRNYVSSAGVLIEQFGAHVEIKGENSLFVWGDEYKIEEVVMNYFTNALHYCTGEKRIVIEVKKNGSNARVSVFNTGDAIDEDSVGQIWTKFYKADKARSRETGGSGVGLSIVKAIMESHHMPFGLENSDEGPTFYFELEAC